MRRRNGKLRHTWMSAGYVASNRATPTNKVCAASQGVQIARWLPLVCRLWAAVQGIAWAQIQAFPDG